MVTQDELHTLIIDVAHEQRGALVELSRLCRCSVILLASDPEYSSVLLEVQVAITSTGPFRHLTRTFDRCKPQALWDHPVALRYCYCWS